MMALKKGHMPCCAAFSSLRPKFCSLIPQNPESRGARLLGFFVSGAFFFAIYYYLCVVIDKKHNQ